VPGPTQHFVRPQGHRIGQASDAASHPDTQTAATKRDTAKRDHPHSHARTARSGSRCTPGHAATRVTSQRNQNPSTLPTRAQFVLPGHAIATNHDCTQGKKTPEGHATGYNATPHGQQPNQQTREPTQDTAKR